ncbi:MAG: acyloxyacyl hydrolase [Elusimicrobia bacterium]|nr:acyloxyacyl hydrolase [Elusimicrobiota bacterium]
MPGKKILAGMFLLSCVFLPREAEAGSHRKARYAPLAGRNEWSLLAGIGQGRVPDGPRLSMVFTEVIFRWSHFFSPLGAGSSGGQFHTSVEVIPYFEIDQDPRVYGAGANALLCFTPSWGPYSPSFEAGVGGLRTSSAVPPGTVTLNFTPQAGLKWQVPFKAWERFSLAFEYRFHHLSNAGRSDTNPGINSHLLLLGVSWYD